ncbi:hypothetical protein C8F01DRAFT_1064523 [Mycena amicta]|nr:hypothetical protein C8F01DRAFT_1064523 [Mycena amicta]
MSPSPSPPLRVPPTPPPDDSAVVAQSTLSTSVSSPAWFPSVASPLVPSSSTATLVDDATLSPPLEKGKSTLDSPAFAVPPVVHKLEEGEIADVVAALLTMGVTSDSTDLEPGEILEQTSSVPDLSSSLPPLPPSPASSDNSSPEIASPLASTTHEACVESPAAESVEPTPTKATTTSRDAPCSPTATAPRSQQPASSPSFAPHLPEPVEKTPNVYINGLPPNFPEDQLFALASPFGVVRSVRSFTRHVGDTETGYGFVLFDTIAAAERCINSLRRYRNLHPTFSKQVHKIPGTVYAASRSAPSSQHNTSSASSREGNSSLQGWEQEEDSANGDPTFKARMERLADKSSTNLYIEGLPLSIDEATLSALVSPYSIRSSRFFQTRLSNPPRIIAFVRLETRTAAEEIIERLHGRMVRGWNDPGSRISVRFADTAEQRELRRQERLTRDGEGASGQLSIAQATLLNLRGKELGGGGLSNPKTNSNVNASSADLGGAYHHASSSSSAPSSSAARIPVPAQYANVDAFQQYDYHSSNPYAYQQQPQQQPYHPREFEVDYSHAPQRYTPSYPQQPYVEAQPRMNPSMVSLLESLQARAVRPFVPAPRGNAHGLGISGGYTPTEEFLLRARSNSLPLPQTTSSTSKRRPLPLDLNAGSGRGRGQFDSSGANIGMGVRGYRAQASTVSFRHSQPLSPVFDAQESSMNEEDFHAQAQRDNGDRIMNQLLHNNNNNNTRMSRNSSSSLASAPPSNMRAQNTDFIPQSLSNHHYQHPHSHQHTSFSHGPPAKINTTTNMNIRNGFGSSADNNSNIYHGHIMYSTHAHPEEQAQTSPPLVSPALTYSSSRSSGTGPAFSPTTPFFGSFEGEGSDGETTFRGQAQVKIQSSGVKGKKTNTRTLTR